MARAVSRLDGLALCATALAAGALVGSMIPRRRPADAFGVHQVGDGPAGLTTDGEPLA